MLTSFSFSDIEFEVPTTWQVGEIDGAIEILDAKREGALHISLLRRTKTRPLSESEARLLVDSFASNSGLVPVESVSSIGNTFEARAIGSFRPTQPTAETPLHWLVGCVVWPNRAVQASYCTDSVDVERLKEAAEIIGSIRIGIS